MNVVNVNGVYQFQYITCILCIRKGCITKDIDRLGKKKILFWTILLDEMLKKKDRFLVYIET